MEIDGMEANNSAAAKDGTAAGPSSTHASTEGQGIDTSAGYNYEVFLSFRGPDTRATLTDFLWTTLDRWGIRTFKDDESLRTGEEFEPKLLQAINESKISIPIFSKGYASSVWCLKELAQMVKCQKKGTQQIKPIFYDVAPSEVRHQTGDYAKAFDSHKKKGRHDENTMQEWKDALSTVGAIGGWDLSSEGKNRQEGAFAERVTRQVFNDLKKADLPIPDCFVEVNDDMTKIKDMIAVETSETRIIGIHGMGGIGKTTIAKKIYNELSNNFKHCCFLSNIREMSERWGIEHLQRQLVRTVLKAESLDIKNMEDGIKIIQDRLSTKKVLLLLDDVDHKEHMNALVGKRNWFGTGSKLIITTRNKEVLEVLEVDNFHEVNCMDRDQSLQLFCKHAFRRDSPLDKYIDQSKRAIRIAGGLPLVLEIIGSRLGQIEEEEEWDATLNMLERVPHKEVKSKLKISYNALDIWQKHIFLDIACLFIGYNKDILIHYWEESNFFPRPAMKVLQNLSLIKICEDNEVWMHDQLRDLGRQIVREESNMKMEKQSRVWNPKEGLNLLRRHKGKKEVEALRLQLDDQQRYRFTYVGFENLSELRFLEVDGSMENFHAEDKLLWHKSASDILATDDNSHLLPKLRWLSWHHIPPTFNITNFSMEEVVILDLSNSKITDDWSGWSHMEVMKNLKSLDLSKCQNIRRLPNKLGSNLARLEYLSLRGCTSLEMLPDTLGNLKSLIELDISHSGIIELPDSIGKLKNLKVVKMQEISTMKIPPAFWTIEKLEKIEICNKFSSTDKLHVRIGDGIYRNQSLRIFSLTGASIYSLPPRLPESLIRLQLGALHTDMFPNLSNLINLKDLSLIFESRGGGNWESYGVMEDPMPRWTGNLSKSESLDLTFCCETAPPTDISLPPRLKSLHLLYPNFRCLSKLPSSLSSLNIMGGAITEIRGLGCLENLQYLYLCSLNEMQILPDLSNLNTLRSIQVGNCDNLVEIQGELPRCLDHLQIYFCPSLRNLPDLSSWVAKQEVEISHCSKLNVEAILGFALKTPRDLKLEGLDQLRLLPDLSESNELRRLEVSSCNNLVEIQGELPQSLEELKISSCTSLEKFPDLSESNELRRLEVSSCNNLVEIQGELPQSLEELKISSCTSLEKFPDLSESNELRRLEVSSCNNLVEIQGELPQSLEELKISSCTSLEKFPVLSNLENLRSVKISSCGKLNVEAFIGFARNNPLGLHRQILPDSSNSDESRHLRVDNRSNLAEVQADVPESLEELHISFSEALCKLPDLSSLTRLREVCINSCPNLVGIQGKLPESLETLTISLCKSLLKLPDLSCLKKLQRVDIRDCAKLEGEAILGSSRRSQVNLWENLQYLRICGLGQLEILLDLSNSSKLRHLRVEKCSNLLEIQGKLPESLEELEIVSCNSLQKLPDLSSLKGLRRLIIDPCVKLNVEVNSWLCSEKLIKFEVEYRESEFSSEAEGEDEESEYESMGEDEE